MSRIFPFILLCLEVTLATSNVIRTNLTHFPAHFNFGVATSAHQIEGAWNESGKGVSVWDTASHTPGRIIDGSTADIACDSYHKLEDDIAMLRNLKVHCYRFSISWTRIFPTGMKNSINVEGVAYYNRLIDRLIEIGVEPVVTMFHWDTPQILEDLGGWTNDIMIQHFVDYADTLFELFGDRVKTWGTMNEPANYCQYAGTAAPFKINPGVGSYLCGHNIIRAHAKVFRLYQEKYKAEQKGWVGITLDSFWNEPLDGASTSDWEATQVALEFYFGWFAYPIYKTGDYPESMRRRIDARSKAQGFTKSRLPHFTEEEKSYIYGSYDFLGLNHYATFLTTFTNGPPDGVPSIANDRDVTQTLDPTWRNSSGRGFTIRPESLRKLLLWVDSTFGKEVQIAITENGYSGFPDRGFNDQDRVDYLNSYLEAILDAINLGVNVQAYTWWSLMDNFEWSSGYTRKFGLYQVDFNDPQRTRTARKSALVYRNVIETGRVNRTYDPSP